MRADRCRDLTHGSYSADARYDTCTFLGHLVEAGGAEVRMGEKALVGRVVDATLTELVKGMPLRADIERYIEIVTRAEVLEAGDGAALYSIDEMTSKALALVALATNEVIPSYGAIHDAQVEIHWEHEGRIRHSHLDLVTMAGDIVDWKTSEQRLPNRAADLSVQLTEYACAFQSVEGELPRSVILDGLIYANPPKDVTTWRPTATKPWWDRSESSRTLEQLEAHRAIITTRDIHRRWQEMVGVYLTQGRGHPWACTDCPAKSQCPAWAGTEFEGAERATKVS